MSRVSLHYDSESHRYSLDQKPIPGVTRVLADLGYAKGAAFYTQASRDRGRMVHLATELVDIHCPNATTIEEVQETLDLGPGQIPYITGYLKWRRETGFKVLRQEEPVCSPKLRVGGKFDKYGTFPDGTKVLVDVKSWQSGGVKPQRSAEIQTGLYKRMLNEYLELEVSLRIVLKLSGDNDCRAYLCQDPGDEAIGTYCAKIWWDRKHHGLIEGDGSDLELVA